MKSTISISLVTALALIVWNAPARAQTSIEERLESMERRIQYLERRIADQDRVIVEKEREISRLTGQEDAWFNNLEITGAVEIEASRHDPFEGDSTSDVAVATAAIGIGAQVNDRVSAEIGLLYEEDDTDIEVDTASMTAGPPEGAWSVTAGQVYLPFGIFESNMISDPLTLEIGETRETAVQFDVSANGFSGSAFLFNGANNEGGKEEIDGFGVAAGYAMEGDERGFALNLGYVNDVGDSDGLEGVIGENLGEEGVYASRVPGWTGSVILRFGAVSLIGEYLSAMDEFQPGEISFGEGRGAQPSAWSVEAGYGFSLGARDATLALAAQGTDQALDLELPESRYLASLSVDLADGVGGALEWARDEDYDTTVGGTGSEADTVTAQVAVEF